MSPSCHICHPIVMIFSYRNLLKEICNYRYLSKVLLGLCNYGTLFYKLVIVVMFAATLILKYKSLFYFVNNFVNFYSYFSVFESHA